MLLNDSAVTNSSLSDHHFIFIAGLHRSGTTTLFECMRDHPQISGFRNTGANRDEGQFLQTVYARGEVHGGPGRFGFDPQAALTETSVIAAAENARKLFGQWSPYWDLNRPYLLEKSPPNIIRTRFLQALFPNSYFVVLMRHPVAVSLATRKWAGKDLGKLMEHWLTCHERFMQDSRFLRKVLIINYENFVTRPQVMLNEVCAFVGLDPVAVRQKVLDKENERYFAEWRDLSDQPDTSVATEKIRRSFEDRCNRFGYSLTDLERVTPFSLELGQGCSPRPEGR